MDNVWGSIPHWLSVVVAFIALWIAYFQLRNMLKTNELKLLLDIERELYERKSKIDDISSKIRQSENDPPLVEIYYDDLEAAQENFFNVLDRLCYCIHFKYLDEERLKDEYRELILDTIRYNQDKFGVGTHYKNILKVYKKWENIS